MSFWCEVQSTSEGAKFIWKYFLCFPKRTVEDTSDFKLQWLFYSYTSCSQALSIEHFSFFMQICLKSWQVHVNIDQQVDLPWVCLLSLEAQEQGTVSLIILENFSDPSLHCHIHLNPSSAELCFPQTLLPPQLATHATWNMLLNVLSHTSNRLIVVSPCINIGSCSRNGSAHFHQCYCFSVIVYSDIVFILALSATWLLLCYGHLCCPCVVLQIQLQPMVPLFIELYFISITSMKTPG